MDYEVEIVKHPAKRLAGVWTRSSMATAGTDCPAAWERLMVPATAILGANRYDGYGVSTDFTEDMGFVYWAALDVPLGMLREPGGIGNVGHQWPAVPLQIEGLGIVDLRAGQYAVAAAPTLAALSEVYGYLYGAWAKTQAEYAVDCGAASFELYPAAWREGDPVRVFVPVNKVV